MAEVTGERERDWGGEHWRRPPFNNGAGEDEYVQDNQKVRRCGVQERRDRGDEGGGRLTGREKAKCTERGPWR